jgi:hypothetical protein
MKFARTAKALAITAGAAFALSGCIKLDMDMKVKADTKIDGTMIVAFNEEAMKSMESMMAGMGDTNSKTPTTKPKSFEQQMKDSVKESQADLPKGSSTKLYKKDGWLGQEIKFSNVDANVALGAGMSAGSATGGTSSSSTDTLKITKKGNTLEMNGSLDLGGGSETGGGDMTGLMGAAKPELRIKFSFPGKVTSASKGGKISGNSVTWTPKFGEKVILKATANAS